MDTFEEFPLVLEVRHESWNVLEFYADLAERDVGFVNIEGQAAVNALQLQAILEGDEATSPPPLFEAYQDALKAFAEPDPEPITQDST